LLCTQSLTSISEGAISYVYETVARYNDTLWCFDPAPTRQGVPLIKCFIKRALHGSGVLTDVALKSSHGYFATKENSLIWATHFYYSFLD
jgi:hypothetical protein